MKKIKDVKIVILAMVLLVFTIGYFIIANKISYAFENNIDMKTVQVKKLNIITKCAELYGKNNKEKFNDEGLIYITVQNLINEGYLASNDIKNEPNIKNDINDKKIRIKMLDDKITAEIYT